MYLYLDKGSLSSLDDNIKELIISGELSLFTTNLVGISYIIKINNGLFFGLDQAGGVKTKSTQVDNCNLVHQVLFTNEAKSALKLNKNFNFSFTPRYVPI